MGSAPSVGHNDPLHCCHLIDKLTADSTTEEEVVLSSSQRLVGEDEEGPSTRPLPQACPIPRSLTIGRGVGGAPVTSELVEVREVDVNQISQTIVRFKNTDWNRTTLMVTPGF